MSELWKWLLQSSRKIRVIYKETRRSVLAILKYTRVDNLDFIKVDSVLEEPQSRRRIPCKNLHFIKLELIPSDRIIASKLTMTR